ncbi:MAG: polysaccharide biosynthesis tyrosine autokinase [Elusimicrobiota bacterium]|jgi:capsular exopolysaccharide synthesis family protein
MSELESESPDIELTHYLEVLLRRRWIVLATFAVVMLSSALYTLTTRPTYRATALLLIEKERSGTAVFTNGSMIEASNEDYYQTQYRLLKSDTLIERIYDDLQLATSADFPMPGGPELLKRAITIAPIMRSRLVNVHVDSHDSRTAAAIANAICDRFVEQNLANQLFISKEVLHALQLSGTDAETRALHEALPSVVNNKLIQDLKADYAKLQSQYADQSRRYTEKHPALASLRSNMAALRSQIDSETLKVVQSMKTELSGQLKGNNVRVVDPAKVPVAPFKPKVGKTFLIGIILGAFLAALAAFLVEALDQSLRTQEDVELKLNQPFLGSIPYSQDLALKARIYQPLVEKESSLTSESFRNLRTMVDFAGVADRARQIMVTSTMQEEGKTYIASNLAVAIAQLGENVLLIDGDLRRPKLHRNFHVTSERGVSDFLATGESMEEAETSLREVPGVPNLRILPCGTRPPNPSELLNTPKLAALVTWAKSRFDRVIVDCPPMFPIHDTMLWGRHIRAAVFVVRYGKTRTPLVRNAAQRLKAAGVKVLGVSVNAARPSGLTYAAYGYHYQQYYTDYTTAKPASVKS